MSLTGKVSNFDYGTPNMNRAMYGSSSPPLYDIETLPERLANVPMSLYYGSEDAMIPEGNFERMRVKVLPNASQSIGALVEKKPVVEIHKIHDYNHVDYMWAADASDLVNTPIRDFIKRVIAGTAAV